MNPRHPAMRQCRSLMLALSSRSLSGIRAIGNRHRGRSFRCIRGRRHAPGLFDSARRESGNASRPLTIDRSIDKVGPCRPNDTRIRHPRRRPGAPSDAWIQRIQHQGPGRSGGDPDVERPSITSPPRATCAGPLIARIAGELPWCWPRSIGMPETRDEARTVCVPVPGHARGRQPNVPLRHARGGFRDPRTAGVRGAQSRLRRP